MYVQNQKNHFRPEHFGCSKLCKLLNLRTFPLNIPIIEELIAHKRVTPPSEHMNVHDERN